MATRPKSPNGQPRPRRVVLADGSVVYRIQPTLRKPNGEPWRPLRTFPTEKAAIAWAADELRKSDLGGVVNDRGTTVPQVVTRWLNEGPRKEATTMENYRRVFRNHIEPRFKNLRVQTLKQAKVAQIVNEVGAAAAANAHGKDGRGMARIVFKMLHTAHAWAASEDVKMIQKNPMAGAKFDYHTQAEHRDFIPLERVLALFDASEGLSSNIVWRTLFETGARKGEILGANVEDLDVAGARIWIDKIADPTTYGMTVAHRTKTKKNRWVDVSPELAEELRQMAVGRKPSDPLLPGHDGRRINFNTYRSWWLRDLATAGLTGYSAHQLRHSFATFGMLAGVAPNVLASMLGHHSPVTTLNVYAGSSKELRKDAAAAIYALVAHKKANSVANKSTEQPSEPEITGAA